MEHTMTWNNQDEALSFPPESQDFTGREYQRVLTGQVRQRLRNDHWIEQFESH